MTSPGLEINFAAQICASLDGLKATLDREAAWRQKQAQVIRQIPFAGAITLSGGAGTDDQPDKLQAKTGYIWCIRRLTVQGFTAGTVTAYRNSTAGEPVLPFATAGVNTLGKGQLLLMPGDRLIWSATGITGTASYWGAADCLESWYLPYYLG
jgi:hypothetical protein